MPWIIEIQNYEHAEACLERWFGNIPGLKDYAMLATLLSDKPPYAGLFVKGLCDLSASLWNIYLDRITSGSNKLTRAIQLYASDFGFAMHTQEKHVVFIDQLSEQTFLNNVHNKTLWKDSFGFGHGEFSHSYQWLVAGTVFNWSQKTAELYAGSEMLSKEDIFYLDGANPKLGKRPLWQWLVDSVPDNKALAKYEQIQGYTPEHVKYNGHCLTIKTFRNANFVQTELINHKDWFLGFYADRRSARLDGIARETLKKEGEDTNPKWSGTLLKAQQRGLVLTF